MDTISALAYAGATGNRLFTDYLDSRSKAIDSLLALAKIRQRKREVEEANKKPESKLTEESLKSIFNGGVSQALKKLGFDWKEPGFGPIIGLAASGIISDDRAIELALKVRSNQLANFLAIQKMELDARQDKRQQELLEAQLKGLGIENYNKSLELAKQAVNNYVEPIVNNIREDIAAVVRPTERIEKLMNILVRGGALGGIEIGGTKVHLKRKSQKAQGLGDEKRVGGKEEEVALDQKILDELYQELDKQLKDNPQMLAKVHRLVKTMYFYKHAATVATSNLAFDIYHKNDPSLAAKASHYLGMSVKDSLDKMAQKTFDYTLKEGKAPGWSKDDTKELLGYYYGQLPIDPEDAAVLKNSTTDTIHKTSSPFTGDKDADKEILKAAANDQLQVIKTTVKKIDPKTGEVISTETKEKRRKVVKIPTEPKEPFTSVFDSSEPKEIVVPKLDPIEQQKDAMVNFVKRLLEYMSLFEQWYIPYSTKSEKVAKEFHASTGLFGIKTKSPEPSPSPQPQTSSASVWKQLFHPLEKAPPIKEREDRTFRYSNPASPLSSYLWQNLRGKKKEQSAYLPP